jgi:hypothetical protein
MHFHVPSYFITERMGHEIFNNTSFFYTRRFNEFEHIQHLTEFPLKSPGIEFFYYADFYKDFNFEMQRERAPIQRFLSFETLEHRVSENIEKFRRLEQLFINSLGYQFSWVGVNVETLEMNGIPS